MEPKEDPDARALVPANTERQLEAMPLRQCSSAQSYHAQPVLTTPPQPLLLKGSSSKTKTTIKVPTGTRILPPRPNERVVGVKTNRSGEISSIRYTTEEERPYFEGIRAAKVRFIPPPKAAPKHALNAFETPPKRRKTIVDIDEDVRRLDRVIINLQSSVNSITGQLSNHNTVILGLRQDLASANKKIKELERR
jgi:hypothetical protein